MRRTVLFCIIVIFPFLCGCATPQNQTQAPMQKDTLKPKSGTVIQNKIVTSEKQLSEPKSEPKNKSASEKNIYNEKRAIKIVKKDDLAKFKSEKRIALVIGNSDYKISPLRNPVNDANAMSNALKQLNFNVIIGTNLNQKKMKRLIEQFGIRIKDGGVGLFYYAGHGMQVRGRNYLIPIDAKIESENDVDIVSVRADEILVKMDNANNRLNIVILDACRNNPFARSFRSSIQGLATMDSPSGTLIAYATSPGSVASDGPGKNGLYTQELIRNMQIPDLKIEDMFKRVRTSVKSATNDHQIPWESSSLEGDFYFSLSSVILAKKLKKATDEQLRLKKEIEKLEALKVKASNLNNEREEREAELKKKATLAKLRAEELRQKQLEEGQKRLEERENKRLRKEAELRKRKQDADSKLAALKEQVLEKREQLKEAFIESLSPEAAVKEMKKIDLKITEIKNNYRKELASIILSISQQVNDKYERAINSVKSEFETNEEFKARVNKIKNEADHVQNMLFTNASKKIVSAYENDIKDFIIELNNLSKQKFSIPSNEIGLSIGKFNPKHNTFPITIKLNHPLNGSQIACETNVFVDKEDARTFKQHFQNNIFRAEIIGNWQSLDYFRITKAFLINDATNKRIDVFSYNLVDLGNGIVIDNKTNLLWLKNANYFKEGFYINMYKSNIKKAKKASIICENLLIQGTPGWRLPSNNDLSRMYSVYHNEEPHPFVNLQRSYWVSLKEEDKNYRKAVDLKNRAYSYCGSGKISCDFYIWPIRDTNSVDDFNLSNKYKLFSAKFIDLGNGIVYDNSTQLLWVKDANHFNKRFSINMYRTNKAKAIEAYQMCNNLKIAELFGWRLPSSSDLKRMYSVYHNEESHPFTNLQRSYWVSLKEEDKNYRKAVDIKNMEYSYCGSGKINCDFYIWPVRGGNPSIW